MTDTVQMQVLIAGAGPIGLTTAIELAQRGNACRIVDPQVEPMQYTKAVGLQPRTLRGCTTSSAGRRESGPLVTDLAATFATTNGGGA